MLAAVCDVERYWLVVCAAYGFVKGYRCIAEVASEGSRVVFSLHALSAFRFVATSTLLFVGCTFVYWCQHQPAVRRH